MPDFSSLGRSSKLTSAIYYVGNGIYGAVDCVIDEYGVIVVEMYP